MMNALKASCLFILTIILLSAPLCLFAETDPLPIEESAPVFLDSALQSDDVDFFLSGSWKINLSASAGAGWNSTSGLDSDLYYSGISPGFAFSQTPDFTSMILIQQQYLFEASFTDQFDESTFRLGYIGLEDEFLQSVSIGNMGINFSDSVDYSDYFFVPAGGASSFGIYTRMAGEKSNHELLLRFDPAEELKKTYIGSNLVTELQIDISDYLKGQYFYFNDQPAAPVFYAESSSDNTQAIEYGGRYFTAIPSNAYSYSPAAGLLILEERAYGAVLMQNGTVYTVIYDPGIESSYESKSFYSLQSTIPEDRWKIRAYLTEDFTGISTSEEIPFDVINAGGIIRLSSELYGSAAYNSGALGGSQLLFVVKEESSGYTVDNTINGSARVFINGIESTAWELSGDEIIFNVPPGDNDLVEIYYRKNQGGVSSGDILFATANRLNLNEYLSTSLNAGVRWNLSEAYSLPGEETASFGSVSTGFRVEKPGLMFNLEAGGKIWTPNSSGNLLLRNMSGDDYYVNISRNSVYPGALSERIKALYSVDSSDRGELIYREYRIQSGLADYVLLDYNNSITETPQAYRPSESELQNRYPAGPYTAAAVSDGISNEVLVFDYELDGTGNWVSAQLPVAEGSENIDLSESRALSFQWKYEGDIEDLVFYIEAGALSEDLDGDGVLDAETSSLSNGWVFNDDNSEAGTLVGGDLLKGSNGILNSEDVNGSGFLDTEKSDALIFTEIGSQPESGWKRVRINLNNTAADLSPQKLSNCGFVRFTAVNSAADSHSGRILINDIRFESAGMKAADNTDFSPPDFSEISESLVPDNEAASDSIVSPTLAAGESNSLMRVEWDSDWQLYSYFQPLPLDEYQRLVLHIYCPDLTEAAGETPLLQIKLTDSEGRGRTVLMPLTEDRRWKKVEITESRVFINGIESAEASVSTDPAADQINKLSLAVLNTESGIAYIDEIYLSEPAIYKNAGASAALELKTEQPVFVIRDFTVIGQSAFSNSAELTEEGFSCMSDLQTALLTADITAEISWNHLFSSDLDTLSAAHSLALPLFGNIFTLSEEFRTDSVFGGNYFKSNSLSMAAGFASGELAGFRTTFDDGQRNREWHTGIKLSPAPFALELDADFILTDFTGINSWNSYFSGWYRAASDITDFSADDLKQRKTVYALSSSLPTQPLGLNLSLQTSADVDGAGAASDGIEASAAVPLVITLPSGQIKTDLSLNRNGIFGYPGSSAGFASDSSFMLKTIAEQDYLYKSIPIYELFDSSLPAHLYSRCTEAGIDTATLTNSVNLDFSRNYSSRITDLFLPYSAGFVFERVIQKDYLDYEDELNFDIVSRSSAINLFGTAGAFPAFDFYFSDEFNWSVEASLEDLFTDDFHQNYLFSGGLSVFGHNEQIFSSDNSLFIPVEDDEEAFFKSEFMFLWNFYPEQNYQIPLLPPEDTAFQMFSHEEKLSLNFDSGFSAELKHTSSFIIPQRLTISAFALLGLEVISSTESSVVLTGTRIGLSGSLMY